ncbi:MAG: PEP-CTERM sorting domain-containing protein [Acidiferrobacteraceae bacterium]
MNVHPRWAVTTLFVVALGASSGANAALISILNGAAVYDTALNITWLADANYANTSGYASSPYSGAMTWSQANTWAAGLTVGGVSGWRLPSADLTCGNGYNCTSSEMGELFYNELGGVAGNSILTTHNANLALFQNVNSVYWSGTETTPGATAATFDFYTGGQAVYGIESGYLYAWAVHSGDVAAVPEPASTWLFGSGLLGLIGVARRKKVPACEWLATAQGIKKSVHMRTTSHHGHKEES